MWYVRDYPRKEKLMIQFIGIKTLTIQISKFIPTDQNLAEYVEIDNHFGGNWWLNE